MMLDVDQYCDRIGHAGRRDPSTATLAELQLAHLTHVPFENLHVFHRRGVQVDVDWSYSKIVEQRRGGWCFELNGCFGALLRALGYTVEILSSRTNNPSSGAMSPEFDHLALLVYVDSHRYLVDVGWGDCALSPIPAEAGEYDVRPRAVRIETDAETIRLEEWRPDSMGEHRWELQYEASLRARELVDFDARSRYLQTEPGLHWTEKPLVTMATSALGARVTLHRDRLRIRDDDLSFVDVAVGEAEWSSVLEAHFGISSP
jgi:N-hydroxyarylamine O-acetyltransferase